MDKLQSTRAALATPKTGDGRLFFHPIMMMHAARQYGKTYAEFMQDYKVLVESNLQILEKYDYDAVSAISDPFRETSAFGSKVTFNGDSSPKAEEQTFATIEDVEAIQIPDVYKNERTLDRIKAVELYRQRLGNPFPIIGWIEGPLAEASDLMGLGNLMIELMMDPDKIKALLQKTLEMGKQFALAQIKAGANIIGVGDAVCSQIDLATYDEFCLPLHQELFKFIHENGAKVKVHICGNITHLLPSLAKTDLDILDCDWMVNMAEAYEKMGDQVMVCGNLDPVAVFLEGDEALIRKQYAELMTQVPRQNMILMAGCEIPRDTPPENIHLARELSMHDGYKG